MALALHLVAPRQRENMYRNGGNGTHQSTPDFHLTPLTDSIQEGEPWEEWEQTWWWN